jgi:hypothetical protein
MKNGAKHFVGVNHESQKFITKILGHDLAIMQILFC